MIYFTSNPLERLMMEIPKAYPPEYISKETKQMQLIISEKPSVGNAIAAVLGVKNRQDGYLEGNGYLVSWGFGHLTELAEPDTYDKKYAKWCYDDLPILPDPWRFVVGKGKHLVGEAKKDEAMEVKAGDVVLYGKYSGTELHIDGEDYLLVSQSDILYIA